MSIPIVSQPRQAVSTVDQVFPAGDHYLEVFTGGAALSSLFVGWDDATSNATLTLEHTNLEVADAAVGIAAADKWASDPTTITGPGGTAIGCSLAHLGNNGAFRTRLKIVVTVEATLTVIALLKK